MVLSGPEGTQILQIDELNVQLGELPKGAPAVDSGRQNDQNAHAKGKKWLQPFTNKGLSPEVDARRKEILALGKAMLEGYYHISLDKLDQTGERASEEIRFEIHRREQMIRTLIHEDKTAKAIADEKDSPVERETQIFAIHAQKMIEAVIVSLIGNDNVSAMNLQLSAHHACRIVAGDASKRREVAVVPSGAKEALLTGGGLTPLLGSESKAIVAEELKSSKLISSQQTVNSSQRLNWRQQVPGRVGLRTEIGSSKGSQRRGDLTLEPIIYSSESIEEKKKDFRLQKTECSNKTSSILDGELKTVMELIQKGDYSTHLDMEKAYHHVRVNQELQKYFGFHFRGKAYTYEDLPFGWNRSQMVFCRVKKQAVNAIREK
ncbi:MAG: hypothetical protein EZS28_014237 [Streblomastix strix]|uniref:Reverse transcriptase domain-containing protein n=1 Tax=Streblomastix strix TaxID=222440 RepID=A0A5J4W691_9EUKA|nr:MAG: hypothetical protein EZS28_014237 [Streblomastix strix]